MKILFISLSNIGDAVMTTPVLQALERIYPDAVFDIVTGKRAAEVFKHYPKLINLFIKDKQGFLRGYFDLWQALFKTKYDLIVDLRFDGFVDTLRSKRRLTKSNKDDRLMHAVEQHMSVIRSISPEQGKVHVISGPTIWLDGALSSFADNIIKTLSEEFLLSLGPGCGGPEKVWSPPFFAQACNQLKDKISGVILLGGAGDTAYCREVSENLEIEYCDMSGKTSILEAAALIKKTKCFVGNDSGLGHLASAVTTPTITLFGVGDPERYHPWQKETEWLIGSDQDVNNISVNDVVTLLNNVINQS